MKRKQVIILMASVFAVLALLLLAIRSGDEVRDPIAFYYLGPTNGIPGSLIVSCIISNQSQNTIICDSMFTMQNIEEDPFVNKLSVTGPTQGLGHFPSGSTREINFKIPPTDEFRLIVPWYSQEEWESRKTLRAFPVLGKLFIPRAQFATSEMVTNSINQAQLEDKGEN